MRAIFYKARLLRPRRTIERESWTIIKGKHLVLSLVVICTSTIIAKCYHHIRPQIRNIRNSGYIQKQTLTLMTFNIRMGAGQKIHGHPWLLRESKSIVNKIAPAIRSVKPDLVPLQEVRLIEQAAQIAESLNMNYAYMQHFCDSKLLGWSGLAILSTYRIEDANRQTSCQGSNWIKPGFRDHSMLIVTITVGGKKLHIMNIHLNRHIKNDFYVRQILNSTQDQRYSIALGDFNFKPSDTRYKMLCENFDDSALLGTKQAKRLRRQGTFVGRSGKIRNRRIDYIFLKKGAFEVLNVSLLPKRHRNLSDHRAYIAKVALLSRALLPQ